MKTQILLFLWVPFYCPEYQVYKAYQSVLICCINAVWQCSTDFQLLCSYNCITTHCPIDSDSNKHGHGVHCEGLSKLNGSQICTLNVGMNSYR